MNKFDPRQHLSAQTRQMLSGIKDQEKQARDQALRDKGYIPLKEAEAKGFTKFAWDMYSPKNTEDDAGSIWVLSDIEGEKWLVCYTDQEDRIVRSLKKASTTRITKVASTEYRPGDMVEINPSTLESINTMHRGRRGRVSAAYPDRAELTFDDGSTLWVESRDLKAVQMKEQIEDGDTVRMFSHKNVQGKVIKISDKLITFKNEVTGKVFHALPNQVEKVAADEGGVVMFFNSDKAMKQYLQNQQQPAPQTMSNPHNQTPMNNPAPLPGQGMTPGAGLGAPTGGGAKGMPPAIKPNPTPDELAAGDAIPAGAFATSHKLQKVSRTIYPGDRLQKKSTGQTGTVIEIGFDRKLGKFYHVDWGNGQPVIEYDTDIMKLHAGKQQGMDASEMARPSNPVQFSSRKVALDMFGPDDMPGNGADMHIEEWKQEAYAYVQDRLNRAIQLHEQQSPGIKMSPKDMMWLVTESYKEFTNVAPDMYPDVVNRVGQWIVSQFAKQISPGTTIPGTSPETVRYLSDGETVPNSSEDDMWDLISGRKQGTPEELALAQEYINKGLASMKSPDRIKSYGECFDVLRTYGYEELPAQWIAKTVDTTGSLDSPLLRRNLERILGYSSKAVDDLVSTAREVLAVGSPGMDALRGGGGGYPGAQDIDPMGWTVHNPNQRNPVDTNQLQTALQENLKDQTQPLGTEPQKVEVEMDMANKRIVIDFNQNEQPPITLEQPPTGNPAVDPALPPGAKTNAPGPTQPGGNAAQNFDNMEIPVSF